jgi:hypothetical protein
MVKISTIGAPIFRKTYVCLETVQFAWGDFIVAIPCVARMKGIDGISKPSQKLWCEAICFLKANRIEAKKPPMLMGQL